MAATETTRDAPELTIKQGREALWWKNYHPHLKIADRRTNTLVPFSPNVIQQRVSDFIDQKTYAQEPVRAIVLKSRRMGISTIVQMRYFHRASTTRRFTSLTGAHIAASSAFLHGMVEQAYNNLPEPFKRERAKIATGRSLSFVEGSGMETFTAGSGEGAARGSGYLGIHASEVGFWDNASGVLGAIRSIVPDEPGTMIIVESTANGLRNVFRDEWVRAVEGRSPYTPLFFAWFEFPDYTLDRQNLTADVATVIRLDTSGELDESFWEDYPEGAEAEEEILRGIGISENQLAWRRYTLASVSGGDLDLFHQEYPSTPEEAFLSSGRPFIAPALQARLAKRIVVPTGVGDLIGMPLKNGRVDFRPGRFGPLHVWDVPNGDPHLIAADTAGGITSEEETARERREGDNCAYVVINLRTGKLAAEWTKRTDADVFAADLARAGWAYQDRDRLPCEIAVESNNMGLLTLKQLRDEWFYPRIFHRESLSHEHRGQRTKTIGWLTTMANRGSILGNLLAVVRDHPELLPSKRLLDQIRTFVWMSDKRVEHEVGAHDDLVFATAIGYQLFSMRSHYLGALPKERPSSASVAYLESLLPGPRTSRSTIRDQVLQSRGSKRR